MGAGLLLLLAAAPLAAAVSDVEAGHDLARRWCAQCHMVEPPGTVHGATVTDAAPPFAAMARDPAYTTARLRGWLSAPHPPMPDPGLTRREIDLVLGYLTSLRGR